MANTATQKQISPIITVIVVVLAVVLVGVVGWKVMNPSRSGASNIKAELALSRSRESFVAPDNSAGNAVSQEKSSHRLRE
jgi:hypothetical protein